MARRRKKQNPLVVCILLPFYALGWALKLICLSVTVIAWIFRAIFNH